MHVCDMKTERRAESGGERGRAVHGTSDTPPTQQSHSLTTHLLTTAVTVTPTLPCLSHHCVCTPHIQLHCIDCTVHCIHTAVSRVYQRLYCTVQDSGTARPHLS